MLAHSAFMAMGMLHQQELITSRRVPAFRAAMRASRSNRLDSTC